MDVDKLTVVGGGLAGSEAAWQAAERGMMVTLYEMRPRKSTPAHTTDKLAELVCSNSLGSNLPDRAPGLLKNELRSMNSLLIRCAEEAAVPAGGALAVDRQAFSDKVTTSLYSHPNIKVVTQEVKTIPDGPTVIATGPLTAVNLANDIANLTGKDYLYFYDAIAPLIDVNSIDMTTAFRASRYGRGEQEEGDYINCPFTKEEYYRFVDALKSAETIQLRGFEREDPNFFEGCLPVEQIAARGDESLAFGPMRPVGLTDPRTGKRPYAILQLRQDNLAGSLFNMVGFQTNLRYAAQKQVFQLIPGLENAEFVRFGQMHRNTFLNSPTLLHATMQFKNRQDLFFAGQITGVEGYVGNIATGLIAGINVARASQRNDLLHLPQDTMTGALCHYVAHAEPTSFQPMKANFGLLPALEHKERNKRARYQAYAERALKSLSTYLENQQETTSKGA